ncbi:transferase [Myroides marinus]|uniref:transferase n=1 Tax=Myroides marinus TaxID=703342 RepID=UPI0025783264|nr:transferase [Myroides marinus]MDM1362595.1 transferase [Myroides marinus]
MFKVEGGEVKLFELIKKQLDSFFCLEAYEKVIIESLLAGVLNRTFVCFSHSKNKYYCKDSHVYFNPYHSGQYSIFLYYLSNTISREKDVKYKLLADKVYYLNKMMNSCDLFHEVVLPEYFFLDHPVGAVIGRAEYGKGFEFGQNVTVGNNKGLYPKFGENVRLCANSMVLGNCKIGSNVIIGPGVCVKDTDIPDNVLVFGTSPNLIIKKRKNA